MRIPRKDAGEIVKYGTGIGRIRSAFEKAGLRRPEFRNEEYGFFVTVYRETPQKTPRKKYLDDRLWEAFKGNPKITRARLAAE